MHCCIQKRSFYSSETKCDGRILSETIKVQKLFISLEYLHLICFFTTDSYLQKILTGNYCLPRATISEFRCVICYKLKHSRLAFRDNRWLFVTFNDETASLVVILPRVYCPPLFPRWSPSCRCCKCFIFILFAIYFHPMKICVVVCLYGVFLAKLRLLL